MMIDVLSDHELRNKKIKYNSLHKQVKNQEDELKQICGFTKMWNPSMVDWEDPRVQHLKDYPVLLERANKLYWEIEEAEAIRNNTYDKYVASRKVTEFLDSIPEKVALKYLQTIHKSTLELTYAVMENPDYIEETYSEGLKDMEWLPIVRVDELFQKI